MVFLVAPMFVIVPLSFTSGAILIFPLPGWSLRWYDGLLRQPAVDRRAAEQPGDRERHHAARDRRSAPRRRSGCTLSRSRLKPLLFGLLVAPIVVPVVIIAVAIFYFFSRARRSALVGLILGHTMIAPPFVVITVSATLQNFDRNLARAAASLGRHPPTRSARVTLPLIWPGLMSGALFAFVTSFDELVDRAVPREPEQRTLPRQIFSGVGEHQPDHRRRGGLLVFVSTGLMPVWKCCAGAPSA